MFAEQLVIALIADQDPELDATEQNATHALQSVVATIQAAQSDSRVDVVVVASRNDEVLAAAHSNDAVNRRIDSVAFGIGGQTAAVQEMLDDGFVDEHSWIICLNPQVGSTGQISLIERAFEVLQVNPGDSAVPAVEPNTGAELLHLFSAAAFVESNGLPIRGAVSFLQ
jgi:CMP-N-acetylneuraminic acid synthetase